MSHSPIVFLPVINGPWSCDDCLDLTIGQCLVATFCYPCVYGAAFQRVCRAPTKQRGVCGCLDYVWWCGVCCPVVAGVVVRSRYAEQPRPGWCRACCYETACCLCVGAPCAMDDFRTYNCDIGLPLVHIDPDRPYDDGGPY